MEWNYIRLSNFHEYTHTHTQTISSQVHKMNLRRALGISQKKKAQRVINTNTALLVNTHRQYE